MTVVVGSPIPVTKCAHPAEADVLKVKEQYIAQLQRMFEKFKEEAGELPDRRIVFVP